jgi:hypothetical protein
MRQDNVSVRISSLTRTITFRRWRGFPAMPLAAVLTVFLCCGQSSQAQTSGPPAPAPEESFPIWQSQVPDSTGGRDESPPASFGDGLHAQRPDFGGALGSDGKDLPLQPNPGQAPIPQISSPEPGVTALWAVSALLLLCWRWLGRKTSASRQS